MCIFKEIEEGKGLLYFMLIFSVFFPSILFVLNFVCFKLPGITCISILLFIGLIIETYFKFKEVKKIEANRPPRKSYDQKIADSVNRAWAFYKTADELIHNRCNYFLVAESMLLLSFVTSFNNLKIKEIPNAIALVGVLITLSWYYVNRRLRMRMDVLHSRLFENDPIFRDYIEAVNISISANFVLTTFLPVSVLFLWFYLFFLSVGFCQIQFVDCILPWLILIFIITRLAFERLVPKKQ